MTNRRDFLGKLAALGGVLGLSTFAINRMIGAEHAKPQYDFQSSNVPATMVSTWNHGILANAEGFNALENGGTAMDMIEQAAKLVEAATAYKEQVVKQAEGVAQNFIDVYNSYKDAKDVTKRRIYLETLREVLEGPNKIILDDSGDGQGVVPYLPLNELNKNKGNNS